MPHPPSSIHDAVGTLDVELGRRLGEREVVRPEPAGEVAAEERLRERVDRAGEVRHRDATIDDETLDLMEDRHVRRVGRVAAEHTAGHDHVDRRLDRLHHPDLHGRRVRAQQHRAVGRGSR